MMILEGIRVIDWTQHQAGPYASAMLADLGAEVIHIEERERGDAFRGTRAMFGVPTGLPGGRNVLMEEMNRNKKSLAIDLSKPKGREIIYRLVEKSDVFLTTFRRAEGKSLDYETLCKHNPRLIYAFGSGFGAKGPDSQAPSFELMALARSGAMLASGEAGQQPIYITGGIGDRTTSIFLAYGIMAALLARERLGIAQQITVSQLGAMIVLQGLSVLAPLLLGKEYERHDRARTRNPLYNWYKCKDSRWLALGMVQPDRYWPTFCKAIGMPELENDPKFANMEKREENCQELISLLDKVFATRTYEEWEQSFKQSGELIFTIVNSMSDLASDPQVLANEYILNWNHPDLGPIKFVGFPVDFSKTPTALRSPAPQFGQHSEEVLIGILGYTWEEISELREQQVI